MSLRNALAAAIRDRLFRGLAMGVRVWAGFVGAAVLVWAAAAQAAAPAYDSGGTGQAARLLEDARRAAYHGRYSEAIADEDRALTILPNFGSAFWQRAQDKMSSGRFAEASADLDRVIAMHPDDMSVAMDRVELAVRQGDGRGALADLKQALTLPLFSSWHEPFEAGTYENGYGNQYQVTGHMESYADMYSSIAEQLLHQDDQSIADMQAMLKLETVHPEHILAKYCYDAAVAGLLESAEMACQQAIEDNSHDIGQYDSLGYVHVRMKQWDKAIADYDRALYGREDLTLSLYGRGVAKRARGDVAAGNADIAAAVRGEPDIANIMKRLGVTGS
jgi:tetratricopeptide (TPR) repeat protein